MAQAIDDPNGTFVEFHNPGDVGERAEPPREEAAVHGIALVANEYGAWATARHLVIY